MNSGRLKLHEELCSILGSRSVYFQPPESLRMQYPAIVYSRSDIANTHANNDVYQQNIKYKVTVIDGKPDSIITEKLSTFKYAVFERHYTSNNLNHDQFTVSYTKK